ncbi:MAG: hypothetical protein LC791_01115 [Acidobacteria bacterium]|nr:hypothetical protein [Acidobacteriota bacterium]
MSSPVWAQHLEARALEQMEWRAIGPAVMGGRIDDVATNERDPSTIYIGAASGGVWKSTNAGTTWQPIFDDQPVASIGDIALAPSSPEMVWVGTGEPNNRQSSTFGEGVFKSTDGGRTWSHMGLRDSHHIGRILIDPVNPDIVFVAALGRLWGPNKERGVFKTTDGGRTWTNTKFVDEDTGFVDLVMDPSNPQVLFAAAYQRRRTAWGFNGGGPGSGIYKTTDGGRSWKKLDKGLPAGVTGRIGLAVWRKDPRVVFATVEHAAGGIFRSNDSGESWRKVNDFNPRPMYYSKIHIDPTNDRRIYVLGASMFVSDDGGESFADPKTGRAGANQSMSATYDVGVHGDHHALWINPANPKHLLLGNDGGLYASYDGSITWDKINNIPLGQFYGVGVDMETPYNIYGGLQDTHSWGGPSATRHQIGIINGDWFQTNFGDGMYAQVDPTDADTIYTESQGGNLVRFHRRTGDRKSIKPHPPAGEPPYRFNWTAPIVVSRRDPRTIYLGGNRVFKSPDRGETWVASADLTRAEDRNTRPIMGVLPSPAMLSRHDGVSAWGTITTLSESPVNADVLWAGTDDGLVQMSRDGSATWTNHTDRIPGPKGRISRVEASHHQEGTAYVALDRHEDDDFAPYLFVTRDFGQTWTTLSGGLPKTGWINVVREHPRNARVLFVGTETGLFVSLDGGDHWTRFTRGFPTVPVDDLVVHPRDNDLVVGTHGRSIYVLDDLSPLSGMTSAVADASVHLFEPRPAIIRQLWKHESYGAQRQFIGPNPPQGAIINYHLKTDGPGDVTLAVRDSAGALVRELKGSAQAGINRVVWDLRAAAPEGVTGGRGPFVLPGQYQVRLTAGASEQSASLQVDADPALPVSEAERRARFDFLTTLNELRGHIEGTFSIIESVSKQIESLQQQPANPGSPSPRPDLPASLPKVTEAVRTLRQKLVGGARGGSDEEGGSSGASLRGAASGLFGEIDGSGVQQGSMTGPTRVQQARLAGVSADFAAARAEWNRIVTADMARLNAELKKLNAPEIVVRPR